MAEENQTFNVKIAEKRAIADDIVMFELQTVDGSPLPPFTPGAHLGVQVPNGELRKYSLCNGPDELDRYVHDPDPALVRELHVLRFPDAEAFARFRADAALSARLAERAAVIVDTVVWTGVDGPRY